jgi:hypothetical protein
MATLKVELNGQEQLRQNLATLSDAMEKRVLTNSMRAVMNQVLRPAIIAASPARKTRLSNAARRKTKLEGKALGPLKRSWSVVKAQSSKERVRFVLKSNTRSRDAFYAIFLEQGWLAGRRLLKREIRASQKPGAAPLRVRKPVPPRPFVRPAAEAAFQRVVDGMVVATAEQLEAIAKELP